MLAWLAPIIVFGLVVFVHELGHFLAAKAVGVYAPRFSIGFGPALWRRRWGETEYVLAALPLGGFVRMAARDDEAVAFIEGGSESGEVRPTDPEHPNEVGANGVPPTVGADVHGDDWDPNAMAPFGPKPVPEHRWFESKPLPARLLIMIAGVTMNVLLALVVSIGVFAGYGRPYLPAVVDSVIVDRPAARAGMQRGDRVVAIAGERIERWTDMVEHIAGAGGRAITIDVVRGGQPVHLRVTPEPTEVTNPLTGETERVGRIGVAPDTTRIGRERLSAGEAVADGWRATWAIAGSVVTVVRGLFSGQVSVKQLGGPVAIASASVQAARGGLEQLLSLVAFLSVNIAILNLLPVPVLDGGQIVLNILESAKGSAFSARTRGYILRAGLFAIVLLFVLVMFNDLKGVVERLR
jgi:regulator of sigma E protease